VGCAAGVHQLSRVVSPEFSDFGDSLTRGSITPVSNDSSGNIDYSGTLVMRVALRNLWEFHHAVFAGLSFFPTVKPLLMHRELLDFF